MDRGIINVATDRGDYLKWQSRLIASAGQFGIECLKWTDAVPDGSPSHDQSPYAFKPFAFKDAIHRGFQSVLWCDASVWIRRDPSPIFEIVEREGYCFFRNGFSCGQWCTDAALDMHHVLREEALHIPDFTGCCMGLNSTSGIAMQFLDRWHAAATDGVSFIGDWTNDRGQCSADPRCRGHRHDQVIGSIIANQLGMGLTDADGMFSYWNNGRFADSVCIVNGR